MNCSILQCWLCLNETSVWDALGDLGRLGLKRCVQLCSLALCENSAELSHSLWANSQLNWAFGAIIFEWDTPTCLFNQHWPWRTAVSNSKLVFINTYQPLSLSADLYLPVRQIDDAFLCILLYYCICKREISRIEPVRLNLNKKGKTVYKCMAKCLHFINSKFTS